MKVWQVWDGDYDGDWIVATYDSEALARDHADTFGLDRVVEVDVASVLLPEAADPALREARAAQRRADAEQAKHTYAQQVERERRDEELRRTITIDKMLRPSLCHCSTFASSALCITSNGYCWYCGGWAPDVFRAAMGEMALVAAIDELSLPDRIEMRQACRVGT